jgi:hypothetical protein
LIFDLKAKTSVAVNGADGAVPWILMASFLYYHRDNSILSDNCFDELTEVVRSDWAAVSHAHKYLLSALVDQSSSSLYHLKEQDYPAITRNAALGLLNRDFSK